MYLIEIDRFGFLITFLNMKFVRHFSEGSVNNMICENEKRLKWKISTNKLTTVFWKLLGIFLKNLFCIQCIHKVADKFNKK